jgi:hypothetical protein
MKTSSLSQMAPLFYPNRHYCLVRNNLALAIEAKVLLPRFIPHHPREVLKGFLNLFRRMKIYPVLSSAPVALVILHVDGFVSVFLVLLADGNSQ